MGTNKRIKILTVSGFKYTGLQVSQDSVFIEIQDDRQGLIKVPISTISFLQEVQNA